MNNETEQIFILNAAPSQPPASAQKLVEVEVSGSSQVNLENVEDFSRVCRTCATITEFVIPIFSGEGLQNNLADKIHKHLPIQVCESDVLPLVVCYQCASTLLAWHELVQCCVQADAALRARLTANQQESKSTNLKTGSSIEDEAQSKFAAVPQYVVQSLEPPQYREPRAGSQRSCAYCPSSLHHSMYKEHLVTAHSDLLFHCEECDKYIDRKDFILHMSLHAVQYSSGQEKALKRKKVRKKKEEDANQNVREVPEVTEAVDAQETKIIDNIRQENEFSDHSDMEYGFGPLPESVFEAIEDSQDSQPLEDDTSHTHETEPLTDESNKSIQHTIETNNLCNPVPNVETSNLSVCTSSVQNCNNNGTLPDRNSNAMNSASPVNENSSTSIATPEKTDVSNCEPTADVGKKPHKKSRTCPICSKVYTASSSYFYHMKYFHRGSREHGCEVCGKRFGTKSCLTQHMAIHTDQYEFECKHCQKRFKSKASLYIHEQSHGGKKAWSCSQCHASFRWRTHLLRHAARHAAARTHACATCGRAFSVRCDLLRHARTHAAQPLACATCGRTFAQPRYLRVHAARQHAHIAEESH